jgi:hypothetical protein
MAAVPFPRGGLRGHSGDVARQSPEGVGDAGP